MKKKNVTQNVLIMIFALVVIAFSTSGLFAQPASESAQISIKILNEDGEIWHDIEGQINVLGYAHANMPESKKIDDQFEVFNGEAEAELPAGVYSFWITQFGESRSFFTRLPHIKIESSEEKDLELQVIPANSELIVRLEDYQTGQHIDHWGVQFFARSDETAGGMLREERGEDGYTLNLPEGTWRILTTINGSPFEYELIKEPSPYVEVELVAGQVSNKIGRASCRERV